MKKYKNTSRAVMFLFALLLSANSCIEIGKVIAVKSNTAENITSTGAELSATVVDIGETGLSSYGWCWSENQNPSTSDSIYDFGTKDNVGDYSFLLTGLEPGKNYYARSFVSGSGETVYGEELEIVTEALIFTISSPGQGDILGYDMTYQIEWIANISDKLKIELFQNNTLAETIADEIDNSESFNWTVANTIAESNDYHILISSVKNNEVKAETGDFSILAEAPPNVQTDSINNITFNSVTAFGVINNFGTDNSISQYGFCWATNENPDILDNKIELGSTAAKGGFLGDLTGLEPITTYYVRAYATNNVGTSYGEEISFTTENVFAPSVSTGTASNISHNSATVDGTINNFGTDNSATQHGHCWSLSQTPTITDNKTELGTTNTVGNFSSNLSNLDDNTTYYIRAYATNNVGTSYGEEVSFTTENVFAPSVSTGVASNIVYNSATMEGTINDFGTDNSATQHGHCWGLSSNPTIANSKTELGATSTTGSYSSNLTSLESITTYYVRAYATNNVGTSYGTEVSFTTTKLPVPDITTSAVSDISYTTTTCGGDVTNDNGYTVTARGVCWSISPNPTLSDDFTTDGTGIGVFSSSITGLSENTTYYVRAYATNSLGTAYGNQQEFTSLVASTPSVVTNLVSNIKYLSAISGGNVEYDNGSPVTSKGVCWSISQNPTLSDAHTIDGTDVGAFNSNITGLSDNTTYFVRAYAINAIGISYGIQYEFITLSIPANSVIDYDENIYQFIVIGNQTWIIENLKTTHYSDGTVIPNITNVTEWSNLENNNSDKAYCYYNNNENGEADTYGALYTWAAAMNGANSTNSSPSGIQGVCPVGWHIPSQVEWEELKSSLGGGNVAGGKMKETGIAHWDSPNIDATNESGFLALPSGRRGENGDFFQIGLYCTIWSTTEYSSGDSYIYILANSSATLMSMYYEKSTGFSVRCLKD